MSEVGQDRPQNEAGMARPWDTENFLTHNGAISNWERRLAAGRIRVPCREECAAAFGPGGRWPLLQMFRTEAICLS